MSTTRQLNTVFGFPHPESGDPYLIYAAQQYLLVASELYVVRVGDTDAVSTERAVAASVDAASNGGQVIIQSDTAADGTSSYYSFASTGYFRWRLNGVLASKTLVVLADADHPDADVNSNGYGADQLVADLNAQLSYEFDGIQFFETSDKIGVRSTFSFGPTATVELVSVQDAIKI